MKKHVSVFVYWAVVLLFMVSLARFGFFRVDQLMNGLHNLSKFVSGAFPPDFRSLHSVGRALFETVEMAFAGTLLGFLISFPLAIFGTNVLFSARVVAVSKFIAGLTRTVPPLLWAIIFVIIVGLGPQAGTLSIAFYTVGYLTKLYSELFDGTDPEVLEAVKGTGVSKPYLVRFVLIPENANTIVSQLLFMFEYNIRASSILGFVGAGGIGFQIYVYLQTLEYQKLTAVLILILTIVLGMDYLGAILRRRFLITPSLA